MSAARHRGAPASDRAGYRGKGRYRNPLRNQSAKKYRAISTIAAPAIHAIHHHMRTAFAFVLPEIHSLKSHLRSVVAASVASIALARPSFADADREGV